MILHRDLGKLNLKKKHLNIYNSNITSWYITILNIPTFKENFSSEFLKTIFELMDELEAKFSVS